MQFVPANPLFVNIPALRVEVMNPDYGLETHTFNYRGDLLDRRYRLSKDYSYRVVVYQYEFDEQGNPVKATKPDGSEEINIFDFANPDPRMRGKLLQKELTTASGLPAPSRIIWRGRYEPNYQLITEEKNESSAAIKYRYDFDITPAALTNTGKLMEVIHPDATLPDGTLQSSKAVYEYNAKGQLTAAVLADGTRNEMSYGVAGNESSRVVKQIMDVGRLNIETRMVYDANGFTSEKTDGNGNTIRQVFNQLGLVEKVILPPINGVAAEYTMHYDSDKKVISSERPRGNFDDAVLGGNPINEEFKRDVLGFPVKYTLSSNTNESRTVKIKNNYLGSPEETINPDGSRVLKSYDERGLLLKEEIVGSDGKKISSLKVYDRTGKLMEEINPFGVITKCEYDGFSRLSKLILSNGTIQKNTYLKNDLLESEEIIGDDGSGIIRQLSLKTYTYDEKNRRIKETVKSFNDDPAVSSNIVATIFYDNLDRIQKIVSTRGGISSKQYDRIGRVITEIDPMGNEEHFTYDNNGNIIQRECRHNEPDGSVSIIRKLFRYDARNRRIELVEPDGSKITSEYDDRNVLVKQTDYLGITKELFYNSYNNKIKEIHDPPGLNIIHQWTMDNMSRTTAYTDPMGQVSTYLYDSTGRNFKINYASGFSSSKSFNTNNQVVNEKLGSGVEFNYSYDSSGRLIKIENSVFPAPLIKVDDHEFKYDGLNRVISAKAGANAVLRKYDSLSRLREETTLGNDISCKYSDALGDVEKKWPDGRTEKLSHDLNGSIIRIEEIANGALGSRNAVIADFIPSGPNFFGKAQYTGGASVTNNYDDRKRVTEMNAASPAGLNQLIHYRYNASNQKQVEAIEGQNPKLSFFDFDKNYRLQNASDGFASAVPSAVNQAQHDIAINTVKVASAAAAHEEKFLYDPGDARTKYSETGLPDKNYTYLPGHKIQNDGTNAYTHLTDGTLGSDGVLTYESDALGRILIIKSGAATVTQLKYDAFGRPSMVQEAGKPDRTFNYLGQFVEQVNENGIASRQVTLHPYTSVPVAYHSGAGTHYTLFDSRFNLTGLVDATGVLVETYRYKSFGLPNIFDSTGAIVPSSTFGVEPVFGGQKYLSISGLYLSKKRLMNPLNGLFLSKDSSGYKDSPSLYAYVAQNPINYIDPAGEDKNDSNSASVFDPIRDFITSSGSITEGTIWNPIISGTLTRAEQLAINSRRGVWLEYFAGNNLGRFFPNADKFVNNVVVQIKTVASNSAKYVEGVVRSATRDAARAIATNARFTGAAPQAEIIFRTGTSSDIVDAARGALNGGRRIPQNAVPPRITVGLPGRLGTTLKWAGRAGGVLSIWSLANDIDNGDNMGIVGSGSGSLSFLLAETGFLPAAAVVGAFSVGWDIGRWVDKKTGWSDALSDRAIRNKGIYQDLGLGETSSTILGGAANIPILSEVGEGIGWTGARVYNYFDTDDYTVLPWKAEWWPF